MDGTEAPPEDIVSQTLIFWEMFCSTFSCHFHPDNLNFSFKGRKESCGLQTMGLISYTAESWDHHFKICAANPHLTVITEHFLLGRHPVFI